MMNLNDFYVLVDIEQNQIINKIQKLPENWKNISGLNGLSDDELKNLGWINIKSKNITNFYSSPENLELNKNTLKTLISEIRKDKQEEPIEYKNVKLKTDIQTRYSLEILKTKDKVNYKCINGYYTFTSIDIKEICDIIDTQIQKYFDIERDIHEQIEKCSSLSDFLNINYDF